MSKITVYPDKISQPNAHDRNPIKKWCFKEVRRGGHVYDYGCSSPTDPRYFHEWSNVDELKDGKTAQCGRPSTSSCSHSTSHGIAGYRNTCPIAGCNGTYNAPATLRLHFNDKTLAQKGMKKGAKISKINIGFQHRCTGVDVSNGKESTSWGPNFDGYKQYPDLKVLQLYFTNKEGKRISKVITQDSHGKEFSNPPLSSDYGTVTAQFTDITYDEIQDGALNIVYGRNLSTNPGNIYLKNARIAIYFENPPEAQESKFTFTGNADKDTLITSSAYECRSFITHTITAVKQNGQPYTADDIVVTTPSSTVYIGYGGQTGNQLTYIVNDASEEEGYKAVRYQLKGTSHVVSLGYTANHVPLPHMVISSSIKQYLKTEDISASAIKFIDGCAGTIYIYADEIKSANLIKKVESTDLCQDCESNILKESVAKDIIKSISELNCGKHTIFYTFDNKISKGRHQTVKVVPRKYKFKMYTNGANQQEFEFNQNKSNLSNTAIINIQRIDDENPSITPKFQVEENTLLRHRIPASSATEPFELSGNTVKSIPISLYLPGKFTISIQEINPNNAKSNCTLTKDQRTINISPSHYQFHDTLFIRGEDSTSFDYDYVVAWEGDDIKQPIDVENIELICSYDDLRFCVDDTCTTGISQTGVAQIRIENQSQYELDFQDIDIELNFLTKDEYGNLTVTTDEFFDINGMLLNFEENFKMYNEDIADNVSVKNLSADDDLEDEENVYINIKELKYEDSIIIKIPFSCRTAKDVYCQLLVFGEPMKLHLFHNCESEAFDYIHLITYDSIQTNMQIIGETDLLKPNTQYDLISGTISDQCPNECFITKTYQNQPIQIDENTLNGGITYRIKNIDSNNINYAATKIYNDINLNPLGFVSYTNKTPTLTMIDSEYTPNSNDKITWERVSTTQTSNTINSIVRAYINFPNTDEEVYVGRTDSKGNIVFSFTIPEYCSAYTMQELLNDVVTVYYEGNDENKEAVLGKICDSVNKIQVAKEQDKQKKITQLTTIKNSLPQNSTQALKIQETITKITTNDKNTTILTPTNTYRKYKPSHTVNLTINLKTQIVQMKNQITFKPDILYPGDEDEVTIFYKICNLPNNQGILNTTFKTNTYMLIPNQVSKNIYCGIETDLSAKATIEKRIVEQNTLNVVRVFLYNKVRDNHDVVCKIDLGPYPSADLEGVYDFVNMTVEDGDYNINISESNHVIVEWSVGEMKADTQNEAVIFIKGKEIGLSEILVNTFDYLHYEEQTETYHFGEYQCNCRN